MAKAYASSVYTTKSTSTPAAGGTSQAAQLNAANNPSGSQAAYQSTATGGLRVGSYAPSTPATPAAAEETPAEAAVPTNGVTSQTAQNTREYLSNYNADREQKIRDMYSGNLAAQNAQQQTTYDKNMGALRTAYEANLGNLKTAYDNNTASLKTAYDKNLATLANTYQQNLSDAEAYRQGISPRYQEAMNALGAEYERQRRNNNMQAAVNGLNTGAGSQMALAQAMSYQGNQGNLSRSEQEALNEAERGINDLNRDYYNRQGMLDTEYTNNVDKLNREYANQQATYGTTYQNNMLDLKTNYQNKIAEAAANNDYQLAAALLDEYGAQYDRTMQQAEQLAEFGDFSMFANIYGVDAAQQMEKTWAMQNPDLAYNLGKLTDDEYFNLTGRYPNNASGVGGRYMVSGHYIGPDTTYNSSTAYKGYNSGRGYSASRDRAYRGPAGSYVNGVWTPGSSGGDTSSGANDYVDWTDVGAAANGAFNNSYRDIYGGF